MRIGVFEFKPGLWPTLATLLLLPVLCGLGLWQLHRADVKRAMLAAYEQHSRGAPVTLDADAMFDASLRYRHVRVAGRYDSAHQFLLDNQMQDGVPGYQVFTPLLLAGGKGAILVNRGWVSMGGSRRTLPAVPAATGAVQIAGVLAPVPGHGVLLGADIETSAAWPRLTQAIEVQRVQQDLGHAVTPLVLLLDADQPDGFVRHWAIVGFGPERHLGYAFQWFTLAVALLAIYVGVNTRRGTRAQRGGQ